MEGSNMGVPHADKYIFWVCLILAAGLFIGSFFCPPLGAIDPSVLKAGGILVAMQALGIAGQNLANGNWVTFKHGETEVKIGDDDDENQ
jgi:small neutral amino acid transporter SnatA (MarC family)